MIAAPPTDPHWCLCIGGTRRKYCVIECAICTYFASMFCVCSLQQDSGTSGQEMPSTESQLIDGKPIISMVSKLAVLQVEVLLHKSLTYPNLPYPSGPYGQYPYVTKRAENVQLMYCSIHS